MMKYPPALLAQVKARSKGMRLEGINPGAGPQRPRLMVIGEAPGREELKSQIPFHGASGQELMKSLALLGLKRTDAYITSAVRSRPYSVKRVFSKRNQQEVVKHPNRKPTPKEVLAHAPLLDYEIAWAKPKIIAAVGDTAVRRLLGPGHQISREHGKILPGTAILHLNSAQSGYVWSRQHYVVCLEYHPAAVFYNRKLTETIKNDWLKIKPYMKRAD